MGQCGKRAKTEGQTVRSGGRRACASRGARRLQAHAAASNVLVGSTKTAQPGLGRAACKRVCGAASTV